MGNLRYRRERTATACVSSFNQIPLTGSAARYKYLRERRDRGTDVRLCLSSALSPILFHRLARFPPSVPTLSFSPSAPSSLPPPLLYPLFLISPLVSPLLLPSDGGRERENEMRTGTSSRNGEERACSFSLSFSLAGERSRREEDEEKRSARRVGTARKSR